MLKRQGPYFAYQPSAWAPAASQALERQGYAVLPEVFTADEVAQLHAELSAIYAQQPGDQRAGAARSPEEDEDFRYAMFNRSAAAQRSAGHEAILKVLEPLLGPDCHIIANTCWRNPAGAARSHGGGFWHIDSGPHVPRPAHIPWDERIPYPIFAVGAHLYLQDCALASGPTGVLAGSHRSGQAPPAARREDAKLRYQGEPAVPLIARAGDVALFVSDVWHRRLPTLAGDSGRFFLQVHYGRRDIAQRVLTTAEVNHVSREALARARTDRERQLIGLHAPLFYDG